MSRIGYLNRPPLWLCAMLFLLSSPIWAQTGQTFSHWQVSPAGTGVNLHVAGVWPSSCIPGPPVLSRDGFVLRLHMIGGAPPGGGCFAAFRPWQHDTVAAGLANGSYTVNVSYELHSDPGQVHDMGSFRFDFDGAPSGGPTAQAVPLGPAAGWALLALGVLLAVWRNGRAGASRARVRF